MRFASELGFVVGLVVSLAGCKEEAADDPVAGDSGDETGGAADGTDTEASDDSATRGEDDTSGDAEVDEGPWDSLAERPCPEDSFVTFENFGWPHMLTFCNGCHSDMLPADMRQGAPIEINFGSIEDVRAHADRIWARAADQHMAMPPVGPAADEERRLLGEWLACGAPTDIDLE